MAVIMSRTIYYISTALVLALCAFHSVCAEVFCPAGHYLHDQSGTCKPCDDDQYMDLSNHQMPQCYWCTKLGTHPSEYVLKNCTPYADTVIRCNEVENFKYFWRMQGDPHIYRGECTLCDPCTSKMKPHIGKDCGPTDDSICCEEDNMVVVEGKCEQPETTTANYTIHENTVFENTTFKEEDKEFNDASTSPKPSPEVEKSTKIMRITIGVIFGIGIPLAVLVILCKKWGEIIDKLCSRKEDPKNAEDESSVESLV